MHMWNPSFKNLQGFFIKLSGVPRRAAIRRGGKAKGAQYKNLAYIQAYFSSAHSPCRMASLPPKIFPEHKQRSEPACRLPLGFYICVIIIDHYSNINIKNLLIVITLRGFYVLYFQWIQYWVVIRGVWMLFYSERATTNRDNVRISYCIILYT